MPGVAREKPAENTCSHKDLPGMALPAFPKGKPRYQESWGRALIDPSGGPSLGCQWSPCSQCTRKIPHGACFSQRKKKNKTKQGGKELPAGWRTACSGYRGPLFLLHHECVELRQDNRTKVRTADKLSQRWRLRGYEFAKLGGAAPGKERNMRGPDITCTVRALPDQLSRSKPFSKRSNHPGETGRDHV